MHTPLLAALLLLSAAPGRAQACALGGRILGPGGRPAAGVLVAAVPLGATPMAPGLAGPVRTDAQGRFTLRVEAGGYQLTGARAGLLGAYLGTAWARPGRGGQDLVLRMEPGGVACAGTLDDGEGRPVPGAQVLFWNPRSGLCHLASLTGTAFRAELPPGGYQVQAMAPGRPGVLAGFTAASGAPPLRFRLPPGGAPPAVTDWIRAHAMPLATVEPGAGLEDLEPLGAALGGARMVALGEGTHGTREFYRLKHRILEYLVERKGFRVLAVEAGLSEAQAADAYVVEGRGTPERAVAALRFWTCGSEEMVDLLRWMRRWNEDPGHPRKLRFHGFDIQSPDVALRVLRSFLAGRDPETAAWLGDRLGEFRKARGPVEPADPARRAALIAEAEELEARVGASRDRIVAAADPRAFEIALRHCRILVQAARMGTSSPAIYEVRDAAMAENARWIRDLEGGAGTVLWAHNLHVASGTLLPGCDSMGAHLRKALGPDFVNVGFTFLEGGFLARTGGDPQVPPAPCRLEAAPFATLALVLAGAGPARFALDLRNPPPAVRAWLEEGPAHPQVGATFDPARPWSVMDGRPLPGRFDLLVFVRTTTAARMP